MLILLLSACLADSDCQVTATNIVQIALKRTDKDTVAQVKFSLITVSGTESTFQKSDTVTSLQIPVNPKSSETTFRFTYASKASPTPKTDTVTLSYVSKNIIVSPACGGFFYYSELAVIATSFPNIPKVVNSQLSTGATKNLEIKL